MGMQNALCVVPRFNTPGVNPKTSYPWKDATGAFQPECELFIKSHGGHIPVYEFDNLKPMEDRFRDLCTALGAVGNHLDTLIFFCHGWSTGIQAGVTTSNLSKFVKVCQTALAKEVMILLYCCSTGADNLKATTDRDKGPGGDGGFADLLRDQLSNAGHLPIAYAHTVAGHTTKNEYVRVFTPGAQKGGDWVVEPGSGLWGQWKKALIDTPKGRMPVRFGFPFWSAEQLEVELARY